MSMHKIPLTREEEAGLVAHGLAIGTPSQLSDVFRHGIAWAKKHHIDTLQQLTRERDATLQVAAERNGPNFQARVQPWLMECFGALIAGDKEERNHRFLEEALELVQALGCTQADAHKLVDYVYGRPVGEPRQEVGGVMVTLAALCLANNMGMSACGDAELARVWTKVEQIRAKQAAKPKFGPLAE